VELRTDDSAAALLEDVGEYQAIGYEPVADVAHYRFIPQAAPSG